MRSSLKISSSVLALSMAVALTAACGDSSSSDSSSSSTTSTTSVAAGADGTTDAGGTTDAATPAAAAPRSGTPGSAGIPAITENANDLTKQPTVAAGTGTAPTGLVIADVVVGTGKTAVASDTVDVRYTGTLYSNGTVFDASWKGGNAPATFPLSGVVPGFAQGIVGMKIGGRREIVIPPALGYGDQTNGPIPGGSTLVFVVDLTGIS